MFFPPAFGAVNPFPQGRSLIAPTGGFKSRFIPPKPPTNVYVPFQRYKIIKIRPPLKPALIKAFLINYTFISAQLVGYYLRGLVWNPIYNLVDPAQPYKYRPEGKYRDTTFEIAYTPGTSFLYEVTYQTTSLEASRFECGSGERVEKSSEQQFSTSKTIKNAYGLRYTTSKGVAEMVCSNGDNDSDWVKKDTLLIEKADADGNWTEEVREEANNGVSSSEFFYKGVDEKWVQITELLKDEQTVVVPSSFVLPESEPLPEVEEPQKKPLPVIAPPLPAVVPGEPLPDEDGEREPRKIPAPTVPATAPAIKPAVVPDTAQQTDKEGNPVPPKLPPVPTTPKDVHRIGNAGGRIAGRTMRPTPVGIAQEVGRIEQKISAMNSGFPTLGGLGDILRLLLGLNELLNSQKTGTTYELKSVCECPGDQEDCEEETTTVSTGGGYYVDEILARIDAIPPLLQAHKDYKQPICNEKPQLEGDFRTISFISDERTTAGDRYLSKRFRYRSQSGTSLDGLVDHWKDFTWNAGPVCVQHSGHSWGTPQVWASSADEGKRVIQHAGREAGIDPSEVGKWTVSGSNNPRFGLSGRMRVNTKGGYYWITERLGSDARPLVATT